MRALTALFLAATKSDNVAFGFAAEMDFPSGFTRLNTSPYTIQINGTNFIGVGSMGTVSTVSEEASLTAKGVVLELSGADPALLTTALTDNPRGRKCKLWVCLFDTTTHTLVNAPYPVGAWTMDTITVTTGANAKISLAADSPLSDWDRPRVRYYTDGDQLSRYPTDKFFEFLAVNIDKTIKWGVK